MRPAPPWDRGLQVERTALAWSRTTLAFLVVELAVAKGIVANSVPLAAVLFGLAVPLSGLIGWLARRRYERGGHSLHAERPLPDGFLPAALATLAVLTGVIGAISVLPP